MLSGGEKARLALAKFVLTQGTFLVLDEPTNHLDIPSKEMLEEALTKFEGSVIAVSHDRYFLCKIATRVVTVRKMHPMMGTYKLVVSSSMSVKAFWIFEPRQWQNMTDQRFALVGRARETASAEGIISMLKGGSEGQESHKQVLDKVCYLGMAIEAERHRWATHITSHAPAVMHQIFCCLSSFLWSSLWPSTVCHVWQLADKKLKDTKGGYAQFLRENKGEAKVMEEKEKRVEEIEQSTIKAKSKVCV